MAAPANRGEERPRFLAVLPLLLSLRLLLILRQVESEMWGSRAGLRMEGLAEILVVRRRRVLKQMKSSLPLLLLLLLLVVVVVVVVVVVLRLIEEEESILRYVYGFLVLHELVCARKERG